jgi:hypothetical protein
MKPKKVDKDKKQNDNIQHKKKNKRSEKYFQKTNLKSTIYIKQREKTLKPKAKS